MTTQDKFVAAVKLRLENKLEQCQEAARRLWDVYKFQQPWVALLRGNAQLDLGEYEDADQWYSLAWQMTAPNNRVRPEAAKWFPEIALPYAYSRMRLGAWDAFTWQLWEIGRLGRSWDVAPGTKPWSGQPEKMMVISEGGYGDAFLFTRFFKKLDPIQRAASRFVMGPMFNGLRGFRREWDGMPCVFAEDESVEFLRQFRYSTALMSIMAIQGIRTPEDIPAAEPFRTVPRRAMNKGVGGGMGICWTAEENGVQKRIRSIDNTADLEPIARYTFVNLNPGKTLLSAPTLPRLIDANLKTWVDTARVIAGLDCVVTVDTAVAHLAGLLSVKTFVIVPSAVDWKWGVEGEKSFWWPTVTVIRNTSPYTFRPALERVAELLEKL